MRSRHPAVLFMSDLHAYGIGNTAWFDEDSPRALAGRCLLDALEYLRSAPKFAARDWHLVSANAVRLVHQCLTDRALNRPDILQRAAAQIETSCAQIVASRQYRVPYYGNDFWDWACVIDALYEVQSVSRSAEEAASRELEMFRRTVQGRLPHALSIGDLDREWFGPATAVRAYHLLDRRAGDFDPKLREGLRTQALQKIEQGRYRGRQVSAWLLPWHYGQVVSEFQRGAIDHIAELADFTWLSAPSGSFERVLALARVLQGATAVKDRRTTSRTLEELYRYQLSDRPLGQGLFGDSIEASLDVLEALWTYLDEREKASIGAMLDALMFLHAKANTVGLVVSTPDEIDRMIATMGRDARIEQRNATRAVVRHPGFRAIICQGHSLAEVAAAIARAINEYGAQWVIMTGEAEALGPPLRHETDGVHFIGPGADDVVIATSLAPFRIREKVSEVLRGADPPLPGSGWQIVPADPELCLLAHSAAESMADDIRIFFEGMTVTRCGHKTAPTPDDILAAFPGALAVENNGYMMALTCLRHGIPCLSIRTIAHRTDDASPQLELHEDSEPPPVETHAALRLAVKLAELLGRSW